MTFANALPLAINLACIVGMSWSWFQAGKRKERRAWMGAIHGALEAADSCENPLCPKYMHALGLILDWGIMRTGGKRYKVTPNEARPELH